MADQPFTPADLAATILNHLSVDTDQTYFDEFQNINRRLCTGRVVRDLG